MLFSPKLRYFIQRKPGSLCLDQTQPWFSSESSHYPPFLPAKSAASCRSAHLAPLDLGSMARLMKSLDPPTIIEQRHFVECFDDRKGIFVNTNMFFCWNKEHIFFGWCGTERHINAPKTLQRRFVNGNVEFPKMELLHYIRPYFLWIFLKWPNRFINGEYHNGWYMDTDV